LLPELTHRYGADGDTLWVKETWRPDPAGDHLTRYRSTCDEEPGETWRSAMLMPRARARIFLRRRGPCRIERLQDINEDDARAEGMETVDRPGPNLRARFAVGIDEINGAGTWASNPWTIVVPFDLQRVAMRADEYVRWRA
jgi:hypothetical protein